MKKLITLALFGACLAAFVPRSCFAGDYGRLEHPDSLYVVTNSTIAVSSITVMSINPVQYWREVDIDNRIQAATTLYYTLDGTSTGTVTVYNVGQMVLPGTLRTIEYSGPNAINMVLEPGTSSNTRNVRFQSKRKNQ